MIFLLLPVCGEKVGMRGPVIFLLLPVCGEKVGMRGPAVCTARC
jgi:hypothetical protein